MARKTCVVVLIVVALGLIVWAGASNYRARLAQSSASPQRLALSPETTPQSASPDNAAADADSAGMPPNPLLGKQAPNFTLEDLAGNKVSLASFKGRPVLVNFWATWCGPCKYEIPWLTKLHTQYAPQGFEILGVSGDELDLGDKAQLAKEKAAIVRSSKALQINYPVLFDGDAIEKAYGGVDVFPESFYLDKTGKVVAVITGAGSEQEAEADIQKAIRNGM